MLTLLARLCCTEAVVGGEIEKKRANDLDRALDSTFLSPFRAVSWDGVGRQKAERLLDWFN